MKAKLKRILFFSCEPGGAEVLIPVIRLVQAQPHWEVVVLGYGHALTRFAKKEIACIEIGPVSLEDFSLLDIYAPDLLITSATSLPSVDMSEKYLWRQAKQRGIPSLAFLDQWQNYTLRFSGCEESECLAYLPDYINCINDLAEQEMLQEGFEHARLKKFGHPYLSSLAEPFNQVNRKEIAKRLNVLPNNQVALFVSEAIREHFELSRGYDQFDALDIFFKLLKTSLPYHIPVIKLHPKDKIEPYLQCVKKYSNMKTIVITDELNSIECIKLASHVFGMTSIMLIEAYFLGRPTISLQPGLIGENPFVLSRNRLIPSITTSLADTTPLDFKLVSPSENDFTINFDKTGFLTFMRTLL